jgi:hypothetical protein
LPLVCGRSFLGDFLQCIATTVYIANVSHTSNSEVDSLSTRYNLMLVFASKEALLLGDRGLMRSGHFQRMARLGIGALVLLMVHGFCAPRSALAGCNHLVTSRLAQEQFPSLIEPLILDLAGHSNPLPVPAPPRPCLGGWCSGQPATPPVPPEVVDHGQLDSWAWYRSIPGLDSVASSFVSAATNSLRPVRQGNEVFHPPRFVPSV